MLIEERLRTLLAALIIAFSWSVAASALAEETSAASPMWLWSESMPLSASAAQAFSDGDYAMGVRLSHRVLAKADSKRERLIAHHNLCVAHAAKARVKTATRHCQETRRLANKGFVLASNTVGTSAADVLDANLAGFGLTGFGSVQ